MNNFIKDIEEQYSKKYQIDDKIRITQRVYDALIYLFNIFTFRNSFKIISELCKRFYLSDKNVLDIGSFTGYNSFYFKCFHNNVTGIELSDKIYYAQKRYGKYKIEFIHGDIFEYISPLFFKKFDFIFCSNLPVHYDTGIISNSEFARKFFNEVYKSMKIDSIFYYIFYSTKHKKVEFPVSNTEMKTLLNEIKITNYRISEKTFYDYPMIELVIIKDNENNRM